MSTDSSAASGVRAAGRWALAALLLAAGAGHFVASAAFLAQVPPWLPAPEAVVWVSGVIEIGLAVCLLVVRGRRAAVGWIVAAFFIAAFPGNVSQFLTQADAFGLDSDLARGVRLLFQPLLVVWALWCTGAWRSRRRGRRA